jgi:hypothetical protein
LRWETEALLEALTKPAKNTGWREVPHNQTEVSGDKGTVCETGHGLGVASDFETALEFKPEQLDMMVQLNQEMQEQ